MTRAEFFNTYFTGQKELNVMAAMGPTERAQFLSRVLGYEKLRSAQELVRDRRRLIARPADDPARDWTEFARAYEKWVPIFKQAGLEEIVITPEQRDAVSSRGWAFGYAAGSLVLVANLVLYTGHDGFGLEQRQGELGGVEHALDVDGLHPVPLRLAGRAEDAAARHAESSVRWADLEVAPQPFGRGAQPSADALGRKKHLVRGFF